MTFKYNAKQEKGLDLLTDPTLKYILCDGGSRSSKSTLIAMYMMLKSAKYSQTRRLVCRQSKSSCIASVWDQTIMPMVYGRFKGECVEQGRGSSTHKIRFVNGSELWSGGFDNKQHEDAILGQEWHDIWLNECTDASYDIFGKLKTRLNWNPALSSGSLKFICDCNPKNPGHWAHRYFIEKVDPHERKPHADVSRTARLWFSPYDNAENLSPEYLQSLENLRGLNRKRFLEGVWCDSFVGQVYRFDRSVNISNDPLLYNPALETWCSWDFGVAPSSTHIIWYQIIPCVKSKANPKGVIINVIDEYVNHDMDVHHYINIVNGKPYKDVRHAVDPAGAARDAKLESWVYHMRTSGLDVYYVTNFRPHEHIDNANEYMPCVRINEMQCPRTVECFENWSYPTDVDGKVVQGALPNHDEYSHGGTSFYYFTTNRFNPKIAIVS